MAVSTIYSFCHDMLNVDFMVRNCCRSIRSKMRMTWRRNVAGNLIALAVVTVFVVTYVKLLQYNKASSTTFNLVANRHRRPRGLHASHTEHRGSKNTTSRLAVHVVEEHHQGKYQASHLMPVCDLLVNLLNNYDSTCLTCVC